MTDYILQEGDTVTFLPNFGAAIVVVQPGQLQGSGPATINGKKICVEGDEQNVSVPGCVYNAPPYMGGTCTLKIDALADDQIATKTKTGGKAVLLKGSQFDAKFEVAPGGGGTDPSSGSKDTTTEYTGGKGMFTTTNTKFQGT